ncbi:retrotransposon-related protein, partial [Tanacetum coccineum]
MIVTVYKFNAVRTSSLQVASDEQRKAEESVMKLAEDHKKLQCAKPLCAAFTQSATLWAPPRSRSSSSHISKSIVADDEEAVESRDIFVLNFLIGHGSPRSLQLWGKIGSGDVHVLIDNGSTHNFVRCGGKAAFSAQEDKDLQGLYWKQGDIEMCENVCSQVTLRMQGWTMEFDLYVLPMKGPDVVLGIQWLENLGKVTHDYAQQTMEFILINTKNALKGDESLRMKRISLHRMQALLETEDVC